MSCTKPSGSEQAVRAVDFEARRVYRSDQHPGYTSWVSFFPGERGQWYLTCEEVTRPEKPLPGFTRQEWYEMSLPVGYDKSRYLMEAVILESTDDMKTWEVISRQPVRFQHSAGSFGQARTRDARFLRFIWAAYSFGPDRLQPNEIFYQSRDNGQTWEKMPAFHDPHFVSYPHRLRTLRDGTLVLALPLAPKWGRDEPERPVRAAVRLDAVGEMQMTLWFSHDQGQTWDGPLPIYGGQTVSETDFVELPGGHLLLFNNSIFATPGRQFVYRSGNRFTPGPLEKVHSGTVPETVCLTEDGLLIGCMRAGHYFWSDDLGQTWQPLEGISDRGPEVYQPWIQYLGGGRVACAGHYGYDDPISARDYDQYISIHLFRIEVLRKTKDTQILVERDFDEQKGKFRNTYTLSLTCDGEPLPEKELEFWYVERYKPAYDSWGSQPLEERMRTGGESIKVRTDATGRAHVSLPHLDEVENVHLSYQFVVRFNADRSDPDYKPAQTPQFEFYANSYQDFPLE